MKMRSPTIITIITAILAAACIPAVFAQRTPSANEIYIDKDCRRNQQLQFDKFTVFNQNEFTANGQKYLFYAGRYQDGAVLLCLSKPNFNQPKPIREKQIPGFIDKIVRDVNNKAAFIIIGRNGNGLYVSVTNYGLDLSNPDRPKLTSLSLLQQRETLKEGESREHTFQGRAGQPVTIYLNSGGFDHNITLFDTSGKKIAEKTSNSQRPAESTLTVKLPNDGTYKIVVKGGDRTSKGTYTLSVNSNQL